jgi:hypothetical protein
VEPKVKRSVRPVITGAIDQQSRAGGAAANGRALMAYRAPMTAAARSRRRIGGIRAAALTHDQVIR